MPATQSQLTCSMGQPSFQVRFCLNCTFASLSPFQPSSWFSQLFGYSSFPFPRMWYCIRKYCANVSSSLCFWPIMPIEIILVVVQISLFQELMPSDGQPLLTATERTVFPPSSVLAQWICSHGKIREQLQHKNFHLPCVGNISTESVE